METITVAPRDNMVRRALSSTFRLIIKGPIPFRIGFSLIVAILLFIFGGTSFVRISPYAISGVANSPPSISPLFGAAYLGLDVLSQIVFGGSISLGDSLAISLGATLLGFTIGVCAGYFSKLEGILSGATDVILTFPLFPLVMLVTAVFIASNGLIIAVMILLIWPFVARAVRTQVTSVKKMPFVEASKLSGLSDKRIVFSIIVPEVAPLAIAYFILHVATSMVIITSLEYLGVENPNIISWGSMFYWAQKFAFIYGDWWWILIPAILVALVGIGFALMGFSTEEILNPRLRRS